MKGIILLTVLVLCQIASASISTNTFILNSEPVIDDISTYGFYYGPDDKLHEIDYGICRNQVTKTIYFEFNVTDQNGIAEILNQGNISYVVNTSNYTLNRFVPPRELTPVYYSETSGFFMQGFSMIRNDTQGNYSFIPRVYDGTALVTEPWYYTYFYEDCSAYINDSIALIADQGVLVNASSVNTTIEMFADYDAHGSMHIYLRPNLSVNYTTDLIPVSDFLNITTSKSIDEFSTLNEIHLHYSDLTVSALEVYENSLELFRWNGSEWVSVENGGLDSYLNYAYGIEEDLGVYAVFGIHLDSNKCIDTWSCKKWSECSKKGKQTRKCSKTNSCRSRKHKPSTKKDCVYRGSKYKPPKKEEIPEQIQVPEPIEVVIEDTGREILFDINVEMVDGEMITSDEMLIKIGLLNFGLPGLVHVNLTYQIVSGDEIYYHDEEIVPVETQVEFLRTLNVSDIPDGHYTLVLDLSYRGQLEPAKAQRDFAIRRDQSLDVYPILIAIFVIVILLMVFDKDTRRKIKNKIKKILPVANSRPKR